MYVVGIDEVGRGSWAGPLVAGAVLLPKPIVGLRDSKKLSKKQRERLDIQIRAKAVSYGLGWVDVQELDSIGMTAAVRLAMQRALAAVHCHYEQIIIDGSINFLHPNPFVQTIVHGDDLVPAVSAASIIAKVARDQYMAEAAATYPGYGFDTHVGYGTAAHILALQQQGACQLHRTSFKPIQAVINLA